MKTVSALFKETLLRGRTEVTREVSMKRRYWSDADGEFLWEDDWTEIPQSEVISVSPITGQLDTERLNEFKVSNVTLIFENSKNKWREDNPAGYFAQDETISLYPFDPYFTKFRVRISLRLPDGSDEIVSLFTGLAVDFVGTSDDQVQINVQGPESLLENANAENVSTLVTDEVLGTGNGSNTDFTTVNPGVGVVVEISLNGIAKVLGTDVDVSDLDDPNLGATFQFATAPAMGVTVRASYKYWKQNQQIEDLVRDLLTEAGIPEAAQNVDPTLFANPIINSVIVDSHTDWLAGTSSGIDTESIPGSIKIDILNSANYQTLDTFADGNFTSNPVWTPAGNLSWSIVGGRLRYVKGGVTNKGVITTPSQNAAQIGLWEFQWTTPTLSSDHMVFGFSTSGYITDTTSPFFPYSLNGSRIEWNVTSGGVQSWVLYINNVAVATSGYATTSAVHIIQVTRLAGGRTMVYVDGILIMQADSPATMLTANVGFGSGFGAFSSTQEFDNVKAPKASMAGTWTSSTFDLSTGLTSIGRLIPDHNIGSGSGGPGIITYSTRTSTDGSTWDAWTEISPTGQVLSAVKRYIQVKIVIMASSANFDEPYVSKFRIDYQTLVAVITLAKFTGKTVYEAIQELGKFANYEWGFTADEDFFFRSKVANTNPQAVLTREINMQAVTGLRPGFDSVYSRVKVTYGAFSKILESPSQNRLDAGARFKTKTLEIDGGDVIISQDADVATGMAARFFDYFTKPRRRFKAVCKLLPHIDLSDVVLISFDQNLPRPRHFAGDTSLYAGLAGLRPFGEKDQIVSNVLAKIVGFRNDVEAGVSEFDVEEILS